MLVSGDTVRGQFCEEDARASSSDVSINYLSYSQFDCEPIVLPVSSLALRVQETTQKRECVVQFPLVIVGLVTRDVRATSNGRPLRTRVFHVTGLNLGRVRLSRRAVVEEVASHDEQVAGDSQGSFTVNVAEP